MRQSASAGFTLLEVVVSMLLLAIMSVMVYQAVDVILGADQRSRAQLLDGARLQRAWQIISRDLVHMRPRLFADGLGGIEPAYVTGTDNTFLLRFSRGGEPATASNPTGLVRVSYELNDHHQLIRRNWSIIVSPRLDEGHARVLLDRVESVRFEQLALDNYFAPDWPPLNQPVGPTSLPRMVRVTIDMQNGSSTSRLLPGIESGG